LLQRSSMARPLLSHASPLLALTVALALAFVWPSAAAAQALPSANGDGFDSHLFRPALDARGLVSINGADVLPAGQVSLGLTIDYGRNLLRLPRVNGASRALIGDSFAGTLHFDYGIANRAIVGVSAPALLVHGDPQPGVTGWSPGPLDSQSIGFVALHGKLLLTKPSGPLGTAVAVQVGAPVSDAPRNGAADPGVWYWPSFILERRLGKEDQVRIAANVGYRGHAASTTALPLDGGTFRDGSRITYGAGA
jgi:OmpA-OmpF porin, OOP family